MTAQSVQQLLIKFTQQYGINVTWKRYSLVDNGYGQMINDFSSPPIIKNAMVLIIKEKYSVLKNIDGIIGLVQDPTKYLLIIPSIDIKADDELTDSFGNVLKVGPLDPIPVGNQIGLLQAPLTKGGNT